jgi:hypothetical protein
VNVQLPPGALSAQETNLMEVSSPSVSSLPMDKGSVTVHTKPYEIKTVKVRFAAK